MFEIFITLLGFTRAVCQNKSMLATFGQIEAMVEWFRRGRKLTYRKGEYVIRPGEAPSGVFYVEEGLVKAYNISKYGEENLLIIRKKHEVFPLIWAITGQERDIIYEALVPTTVWRVSREEFTKYLHIHTDGASVMLDMVIEMYRIHSERIINLEYRSVRERLISFLLTMAVRFGKETDHGVVIDAPLKQQDIASSINASRETTSRELSALERKGLIGNGQSNLLLKDIKKLEAYL